MGIDSMLWYQSSRSTVIAFSMSRLLPLKSLASVSEGRREHPTIHLVRAACDIALSFFASRLGTSRRALRNLDRFLTVLGTRFSSLMDGARFSSISSGISQI